MRKYSVLLTMAALAACSLTTVEGGDSKILTESVKAGKYLWSDANYTIYVPKNFKKEENLPVFYIVHGANGNHTSWPGKARGVEFKQMLDELIDSGTIQRLLVVGLDGRVNGNAGMTDWPISPGGLAEQVESALFEYEIPEIEKRFGTRMRERHERFIGGQSAGGGASSRLMWTRWQWFGGAIVFSPVNGMANPLSDAQVAAGAAGGALNANIDPNNPDNIKNSTGPDGKTFIIDASKQFKVSHARSQTNSWIYYINDALASAEAGTIASTYAPERAASAAAGWTMEGRACQKSRYIILGGDTDDLGTFTFVTSIYNNITNSTNNGVTLGVAPYQITTTAARPNAVESEAILLRGMTHYSHWMDLEILKVGLLWMFKK